MLCRGEPGIGKTRLAEELSGLAVGRGVPTAWGVGFESSVAPPYWPWRQVLRAMWSIVDLSVIADGYALSDDLAVLAPEVFAGTMVHGDSD